MYKNDISGITYYIFDRYRNRGTKRLNNFKEHSVKRKLESEPLPCIYLSVSFPPLPASHCQYQAFLSHFACNILVIIILPSVPCANLTVLLTHFAEYAAYIMQKPSPMLCTLWKLSWMLRYANGFVQNTMFKDENYTTPYTM